MFEDKSISINVYEIKIPIIIESNKLHCYLPTEMTDFKIDSMMMEEIYKIMKIIDENMQEIKSWVDWKQGE